MSPSRARPQIGGSSDAALRGGRVFVGATVLFLTATFAAALLSLARGASMSGPANEPITPLPTVVDVDPQKARLGERLFNDPRLSRGDRLACSTCHRLDKGGDDDQRRTIGGDGTLLEFNTSTVFNAAMSFRLNWRGNFRTIEEQNEATLNGKALLGTGWGELLPKLSADPDYRESFASLYGGEPARDSVLDALATFEKSLITPNARFDRYLRGEQDAISADEKEGYRLFKENGCIACHQGVNVGGNLFQKFGVFADPFAKQTEITEADLGRFSITDVESDRHVFRVPSLRNIAVTAPYFHDGRTASLEDAVKIMARNQLGRDLDASDLTLIVKFLGTLTGEYRGRMLTGGGDLEIR
jgi:cytochrome c peroxidase